MKFYVTERGEVLKNISFPYCVLTKDNWNDYGHYTLFSLSYFKNEHMEVIIGDVKILQLEKSITSLPHIFESLDENYYSLGQDLKYYRKLSLLNYQDILNPLNDIVINPGLQEEIEDSSIYKNSLARYSNAERAKQKGLRVLQAENYKDDNFQFKFACSLKGASKDHEVEFNFAQSDCLPYRLNCLIGKNGTGKTQFISQMATALSGQRGLKTARFSPAKPLFSRVIAISYSVFDKFTRPGKDRVFSYKYSGLKDSKGLKSQQKLLKSFIESLKIIQKKERYHDWHTSISEFFERSDIEKIIQFIALQDIDKDNKELDINFSSGQSMLLYVLTDVFAYIQEDSLLIFDEPETHLHPNATASLINTIYHLLEKYDSYGILASHSPIVVQDIPAKYIHVLSREGSTPDIQTLDTYGIESFGENISTINNTIFDTEHVENFYKKYLSNIAKNYSYIDAVELFEGRLSFNAKFYLKNQYNEI